MGVDYCVLAGEAILFGSPMADDTEAIGLTMLDYNWPKEQSIVAVGHCHGPVKMLVGSTSHSATR